MLTGPGLAAYAMAHVGDAYMYGVNGLIITEALIQAKARQYPLMYTPTYIEKCRKNIGRRGWDCSSFSDTYTGEDRSANGWLAVAIEKGPISTMPDIIGLEVHKDGHMGTYIGGGKVVEARGVDYGVVITTVIGRPWTHWCKNPRLLYTQEDDNMYGPGDKGDDVKAWQNSLLTYNYPLPVYGADGDYGKETANATGLFQVDVGLAKTGIADDATVGKMLDKLVATKKALESSNATLKNTIDNLTKENLALKIENASITSEYDKLHKTVVAWQTANKAMNEV